MFSILKTDLTIYPGDEVYVYNGIESKWTTGIVTCRYGAKDCFGIYEDLVDVKLKNGIISHGHFTYGVMKIMEREK